jgi:hypothetical protein
VGRGLAETASSTKERGEFLKSAFMATLRGENAGGSDGATAEIDEEMNRRMRRLEEARAQWAADEHAAGDSKPFLRPTLVARQMTRRASRKLHQIASDVGRRVNRTDCPTSEFSLFLAGGVAMPQ